MERKKVVSTRGIVQAAAGFDKFSIARFEPGPQLAPFVEHYWALRYELPVGQSFTQTVLSFPNVHMAFEHDEHGRRALLYGIPRRPFVRELRGAGRVLGVKFHAGGFYPFWRRDIAQLTGTTISAAELLHSGIASTATSEQPSSGIASTVASEQPSAAIGDDWLSAVLNAKDDAAMAAQAERALLARLPERDELAELAATIVREAMDDRAIIKVEHMSERTGLPIRQLQRLFRKYVGVTPKWVIKRFRLQEAAQRLETDETAQWAELAVQLGYFDQAHFINDFKSVLGESPAAYSKRSSSPKLRDPETK